MVWWHALWNKIAQPSDAMTDIGQRQQAGLFAFLMFCLTAFLIVSTLIFVILSPQMTPTVLMINLAVLFFYAVIYGISRSRFYRWGARLLIWTTALGVYAIYLLIPLSIPERVLTSLIIVVIMAGLTLSLSETVISFVLIEASLVAVIILAGDVAGSVFYVPIMVGWAGILTIVSTAINGLYRNRAIEGEARYRELMNANTEGILIISAEDAKILDANPAIAAILGYTAEALIGRYPIEFIVGDSKAAIRQAWEQREKGVPIEAEAQHQDGGSVHIETTLKPYNYLSKAAYVLTITDITERKQVEALVIESEQRFRAIFNESSHFIGVLDVTGKILELNEQTYYKFGIDPGRSIGRYLWDIKQWAHNEQAQQVIQEMIARVAKGDVIRYEVEARDRDELPIFLDFAIKPVWDNEGKISMLIADSRDITAAKFAEQKRVEYERRYDSLFKNTIDAVFIVGLDGNLSVANQRALTMLGCSLEELEGMSIANFIVPDEHNASMDVLERLKMGQTVPPVYERTMRRKNGEVFPVEISAMMVLDLDNKPMYVQSLVRDLSERKRIEQQRFEIALEKERSQMLTKFIEQASHHFRTPITNVKTSLYLLPRFIDQEEKREYHIRVVNQELERLQFLLDDLLTVLRLQQANTQFSLGRINIPQLLNEMRAIQEGHSSYSQFEWQWELADNLGMVIGDKSILAKAILSLLTNAITYSAAGGKITVRAHSNGQWLAVDVLDTGMGIAPEDLPYIFDDFYRSQSALAANSQSSGLGLTICKAIVERHQGAIRVKTVLGEGSHFQILLPVLGDLTQGASAMPDGLLEKLED